MLSQNKILITGYPYSRPNYLNTFNSFEMVDFYLPNIWSIKNGEVVYKPKGSNIFNGVALFNHSNYPLIGGILKGFMPGFPVFLAGSKYEYVFSALEPILLSCLYQTIFSKLLGRKHFIFTWENISYDKKLRGLVGLIQRSIIYLNIKLSDGIVCGNKEAIDIHRTYNKPMLLCPLSGVDSDLLRVVKKDHDGIRIIYAGALDKRKGLDVLINSFNRVFESRNNIELVIVGSGELEDELRDLVSKKNSKDKIVFKKWMNSIDLRGELSGGDIFVYPSRSTKGWQEQFGYSMAEASLIGLPIISTNTGSISGVVLNEKTGILIEQNNEDQLVQALLRLIDSKELRDKMGQAGKSFISDNFLNKRVAEKIIKFITND